MRQLFAILLCVMALPAFGANSCKIRQFVTVQNIEGQTVQVALEPALGDISTGTSGSSAQSTTLDSRTTFIGIKCEQKTHFVIGTNPTATSSNLYLSTDELYFTGVTQGISLKVAFIEGA